MTALYTFLNCSRSCGELLSQSLTYVSDWGIYHIKTVSSYRGCVNHVFPDHDKSTVAAGWSPGY
ncbi:Uncharacterised protein [Yersinia kristensenii]|nr:Uncharacterised protein [Yersinia kristensenii]